MAAIVIAVLEAAVKNVGVVSRGQSGISEIGLFSVWLYLVKARLFCGVFGANIFSLIILSIYVAYNAGGRICMSFALPVAAPVSWSFFGD